MNNSNRNNEKTRGEYDFILCYTVYKFIITCYAIKKIMQISNSADFFQNTSN
jgi:hypothetical protein